MLDNKNLILYNRKCKGDKSPETKGVTTMKDITKSVFEQDGFKNYDVTYGESNLLDHILAQTIKDLYTYSYQLVYELKQPTVSIRRVKYLRRELDTIMEYFDSPLYELHTTTPKSVWIEWVDKAVRKPKINIEETVNRMFEHQAI